MSIFSDISEALKHYGTPRHSGRYPWGSGDRPYRHEDPQIFLRDVAAMKKKGLTELEIAAHYQMNTKQLRAAHMLAVGEVKKNNIARVVELRDKGYTWQNIADQLNLANESTARGYYNQAESVKVNLTEASAQKLKDAISKKGYIDVGKGVELELGIKENRMTSAVLPMLKAEGYQVINVQVDQMGTGHKTTVKVLAPPGKDAKEVYKELVQNPEKIQSYTDYIEEGNPRKTALGLDYFPKAVSSKRIEINYAESGGADKDGVIEIRPGAEDLSLGDSQYAQVRINVDGTHYLKGMAMYSNDLPEGVDIRFNTNKSEGTPLKKVLKPMKVSVEGVDAKDTSDLEALGWSKKDIKDAVDKDNPFGASIKEGGQLGAINKVNEEGDWGNWSKTLASQFLSKQNPELAKKQLDLAYAEKMAEFDEINNLNNPVIKRKLLESFSDDCDASAVHLKAAALPRQASKVILPVPDLKENEVYAPTYKNGEEVILVRYPHGGTFEIPKLRVNNKQPQVDDVLHNMTDAVGINPKTAAQLSGADFDGDTVLVIPTKNIKLKTQQPLKDLKDFDPGIYKLPDGVPPITNEMKQKQMGIVSNLITDMTLQGAPEKDIVLAVKHSMVVIDAEKHHYDIKQSAKDNEIARLHTEYQGKPQGGASTIISRAKSPLYVNARKDVSGVNTANTNPKTGERIYREREGYIDKKTGEMRYNKQESTKMAEAKDAYTLTSGGSKSNPGTQMEGLYANHANRMKALANEARKEALKTKGLDYSPTAAKTYAEEVESLNSKLEVAKRNAPRERQAQIIANQIYNGKTEGNNLDKETKKKIRGQALISARARVGAKKDPVEITDREWEAIQAGAITSHKLADILNNTDMDKLKVRATPRTSATLSQAQINRIKAYKNSGFTIADIADQLSLSTSTVSKYIKE